MPGFAYATVADVQRGLEKQIPTALDVVVTEFLERASNRLSVTMTNRGAVNLRAQWEESEEDSDLWIFVRNLVADSAERRFRNPGGFSSENAGIFSVTRYDDFAKGKITFDPDDLDLLDGLLETTSGGREIGPINSRIPDWNRP